MIDNLFIDNEARTKLMNGIRKSAAAVGATMGTSGSNALIEAIENPGYLTTNDGATILNSIRFADPMEDMGRKILYEAVSRANKQSGDGSSTTTVLTEAIIEVGLTYQDSCSPMELKRSLEACIPIIEKEIRAQAKEITLEDIHNVATISAEDAIIGATIEEIYKQIGVDGIIHWDISKTTEDTYKIGNGITIDGAGYMSPYMCDIDEKTGQFLNVARWKNPAILLVKQKINTAADFGPLFQALDAKNIKEVVVFCDEIEAPVISDLIKTRAVRGFKTLVIKMPTLWKDQWYDDLAIASGAKIIDPNVGVSLATMTIDCVGKFGNIVVSKDDTFIDGMHDLSDYITKLKDENTDDSLIRASRLNTKTARYFIGAPSESALSYKRLKVEDAISATWQALHGGIVPGGGSAMVVASDFLPDTPGGNILKQALCAPATRIAKNTGSAVEIPVALDANYRGGYGLDSRTGKFVDMLEANIVNPTTVEINACKNAISVAATVLTATSVVLLPRE